MDSQRAIEICREIMTDAEKDAKAFDGQPFTGRTVAEYMGNLGAMIAGLANVVRADLESRQNQAVKK